MVQSSIFCIYSSLDSSVLSEIAEVVQKEENVVLDRPFDSPEQDPEVYEKQIRDAHVVLVLASSNSRCDVLCGQCVKYAHDLNKNIICLGPHKGGLFNRQSWIVDEWSLRTDTYAWYDLNSRAAFLAHLRGLCGLETLEGDRVGAKVTFNNNTDLNRYSRPVLSLYKRNKKGDPHLLFEREQSEKPIVIRLGKGDYEYSICSSRFANRVRSGEKFSVENDFHHQTFVYDLGPLTDDYFFYCKNCAEEKSRCGKLLSDFCSGLMRHIQFIDDKKMAIKNHSQRFVWKNNTIKKGATIVGALAAIVGVVLSIFGFPLTDFFIGMEDLNRTFGDSRFLFFNSSIFSLPFLVVCTVLTCVFVLLFPEGKNRKRSIAVCLVLLVAFKLFDSLFADVFHLSFQRVVLIAALAGVLFSFLCFWGFQVAKKMCSYFTSDFRLAYWSFKQEPYAWNFSYLRQKGIALEKLCDMSMAGLNACDDDVQLREQVTEPLERYKRTPVYSLDLTRFPLKELGLTVLKFLIGTCCFYCAANIVLKFVSLLLYLF